MLRLIVSANDSQSEYLYDMNAAESLVLVHGRRTLAEV